MQPSSGYIVGFAAAVCFVCALLVSSSAVLLEDRQVENQRLDLQKKILLVSDLMKEGESLSREEITRRYEENVIGRVVNLESGRYTEGIDPTTYNQRKAAQDPERSRPAPENAAKVRRLPNDAVVFVLGGDGTLIAAAHNLGQHQLPIVGINLGKLGFLAEFTIDQIEREGDFLFNGPPPLTHRVMLHVRLERGDGSCHEPPPSRRTSR